MKIDRNKLYLERIVESAQKIKRHLKGYNFDKFIEDDKAYDAALMQFVNIGEMINRLSDDFRKKHNKLPWHNAIGMRNEIVHGYFEIKPQIVWDTAKNDLPKLQKQIKQILENKKF